ncbi:MULTISPECIES: carbon-nitrogen hydrolase family protein [unclassified Pseudoclavibacter]|uniref:carbon-nitrogen hydrolase family protein n=1 Tax=unclassified Pseudoclavibacter TaxID=2615177 RepID=UPI001CE424E1|nr:MULTISPECIES: carbon-nitrogen hydrolase family protein [unclassified Pseudoclavibacter]
MATPEDSLWLNNTVTIAAGQFGPTTDKQENLRQITMYVQEAADRDASLIVFPEYASYFNGRLGADYVANAESLDGPFVTTLGRLAREHRMHIVAGLVAESEVADKFSNTVVAVGPDGDIECSYSKVHLFDAFGHRESDWVVRGSLEGSAPVFEVDGVSVGLQTCYDLRFPELTRRIVDAGVELVAIPSQWVGGPLKEHHWNTLVQARAIENTVYVLAAGQSIPHGIGRSLIVDPMGVVLSATGAESAFLSTEISLERIAQVRANNPALQMRRLDVVVPDDGSAAQSL